MSRRVTPDPLASMWAWIAHDLAFYRARANMTGERFGKIMGVVRSTVSRMESGEYTLKPDQAMALDQHFDTGGHFARLVWYARLSHNPDWFKGRVDRERDASVIKLFEALAVPGLLQTPEYATAMIAAGNHSEEDVPRIVDERLARQEIFTKKPPPFAWAIMNECVLHQPVGGPEVTRAQLAHLIELSHRPYLTVRVVPRSVGAHMGLNGSFAIMATSTGDVAFAEAPGGGRLVATADEVRLFGITYDRIGQQALPENLSRDLIKQAMEEL